MLPCPLCRRTKPKQCPQPTAAVLCRCSAAVLRCCMVPCSCCPVRCCAPAAMCFAVLLLPRVVLCSCCHVRSHAPAAPCGAVLLLPRAVPCSCCHVRCRAPAATYGAVLLVASNSGLCSAHLTHPSCCEVRQGIRCKSSASWSRQTQGVLTTSCCGLSCSTHSACLRCCAML